MTQYLLQFYNSNSIEPNCPEGRLIKNFEITPGTQSAYDNIVANNPVDRDYMTITDTDLYNSIVTAYEEANGEAGELIFTYDTQAGTVTW
ncbi:MAG: hypothetical protein ACYS1A_18905 [Planctomycetota bacterium]|jgi:hypothetical protein